jgi:hypothetical protein
MKDMGYNFIEDDFSAYDSTQSQGCHEAEKWFYDTFPGHSIAKNVVTYQANTIGYGRWHAYSCPNTRKSGDQNTSIGNTFINFLAHAYAIKTYVGNTKIKYFMIGLGDDNLLAVNLTLNDMDDFLVHCEKVIKQLGLKPKMKISNKAPTYCSCEFVPVGVKQTTDITYVMIPSVLRTISKMGFTVGQIKTADDGMRLKGNMLGNPLLQHMPILRVFYNYYASLDCESKAEYKYNCHALSGITAVTNVNETMEWFTDTYGLDGNEIIKLEKFIGGILVASNLKPFIWNHEYVARMIFHRESVTG